MELSSPGVVESGKVSVVRCILVSGCWLVLSEGLWVVVVVGSVMSGSI